MLFEQVLQLVMACALTKLCAVVFLFYILIYTSQSVGSDPTTMHHFVCSQPCSCLTVSMHRFVAQFIDSFFAQIITIHIIIDYKIIINHASRLVCWNDPDLKWLPDQSMYYV